MVGCLSVSYAAPSVLVRLLSATAPSPAADAIYWWVCCSVVFGADSFRRVWLVELLLVFLVVLQGPRSTCSPFWISGVCSRFIRNRVICIKAPTMAGLTWLSL